MGGRLSKLRKGWRVGLIPALMLVVWSSYGFADWTPVVPPVVSSNWGLQAVQFAAATDGWAVGIDYANKSGVSLRFRNGSWESIPLPEVSSDWELHGVAFNAGEQEGGTGATGWAVGVDRAGGKGVLLKFAKDAWTVVIPPDVSLDWALYGVSFTSASEGWAAGIDYSNQRGVLLHFTQGIWTNVIPPNVSLSWGLYGIHMISVTEGWAVGVDHTNARGVLLQLKRERRRGLRGEDVWGVITPPQVDSDWELTSVRSLSTSDGWAAGIDHASKSGVLLHRSGTSSAATSATPMTWSPIIPPAVSSDWELTGVQVTSVNTGWAVGIDYANRTGVLLQLEKGSWTLFAPPAVSSDWELNGIRLSSSNEGWAVGYDRENQQGVLLRFSTAKSESVTAPALPDGPASGAPGVDYTYTATGSTSSLGHSVQYFFDWGDGTNSGWLPAGTVSASKNWASPGSYSVKAQARCATHNSVLSKFSQGLTVIISSTAPTILLQSPGDGTRFDSCSLYSLPTFTWEGTESFSSYEIQFSKTENFSSTSVKDSTSSTALLIDSKVWSKVLMIPGTTGGPVYWRIVGTRANKTTATSDVFSISIDPAQAVGNPGIADTRKSALPTLTWENHCNIKFKVWFGRDGNFSKKLSLSFAIKNPIAPDGSFTKTLSSDQWRSVMAIVGSVSGSTLYWYVESWDGVNRRTLTTPPASFVLTD